MNTGKKIKTVTVLAWIFTLVYFPAYLSGFLVYLLSKLLRSAGLMLMLKKHSAMNEFDGFWRIYMLADDVRK